MAPEEAAPASLSHGQSTIWEPGPTPVPEFPSTWPGEEEDDDVVMATQPDPVEPAAPEPTAAHDKPADDKCAEPEEFKNVFITKDYSLLFQVFMHLLPLSVLYP